MAAPAHRVLQSAMTVYRIGDPKGQYPIYSPEGARRIAGRWHRKGQPVIYAASTYSLALLERLVHYSGSLPAGQHYISIELPAGLSYEVVTVDRCPGWHDKNQRASRLFGSSWVDEQRSAILIVPSVVARIENNVVINTRHPHYAKITHSLEMPLTWDERLFE